MYFLNQRTGAIYKQSSEGEKKTFSINWFYIGEDNRLYYHPTYCLIQKILRSCCNAAQATGHFRHVLLHLPRSNRSSSISANTIYRE